jgi:hypothetical protein
MKPIVPTEEFAELFEQEPEQIQYTTTKYMRMGVLWEAFDKVIGIPFDSFYKKQLDHKYGFAPHVKQSAK